MFVRPPTADRKEISPIFYNPNHRSSISRQRAALPIFKKRREILYAVERYRTTILIGDTGSGKSTQVPQYLHEAGWSREGMIGCTQPTRVATVALARRVASERSSRLGEEVGFEAMFGRNYDDNKTRIKYVTDNHLIREMMVDPLLSKYSVLIVDEAHERSLFTDVIFGLLRKIRVRRPDLRLVISSATIEAEKFLKFFERGKQNQDTSIILSIFSMRNYPIDVMYLEKPISNYIETAVQTTLQIHARERPGTILVFMPGIEEVESVARALRDRNTTRRGEMQFSVQRLYSDLSTRQQLRALEPTRRGVRKIVIATSIAETSVTISDVRYVVDSLFTKIQAYNPLTSSESFALQPVSKASAIQRAGRAGRQQSGKVYRLCTEADFESTLREHTIPAMQRSALAWIVLQLKALGVDDVLHFDFVSPPSAAALCDGLELLFALGAIDERGDLTDPLGLYMAEFPVEPRVSKMLLSSFEFGCSEEALIVAAMTSARDIFMRPPNGRDREKIEEREKCLRSFGDSSGDHASLLCVYREYIKNQRDRNWCNENFLNARVLDHVFEIHRQLTRYLRRFAPSDQQDSFVSCGDDSEALLKCVSSGFFCNCARLVSSGNYRTIRGNREVMLHPSSMLVRLSKLPNWIIFHDVVFTTREYVRDVSGINPHWIETIASHFYEVQESSNYLGDVATNSTNTTSGDDARKKRKYDLL